MQDGSISDASREVQYIPQEQGEVMCMCECVCVCNCSCVYMRGELHVIEGDTCTHYIQGGRNSGM